MPSATRWRRPWSAPCGSMHARRAAISTSGRAATGITGWEDSAEPPPTYPDTWLSGYLTQSVTLYGTTSRFPVWGGALARFSFEESSPPFYNGSALTDGQHLTCATCPSSVNGAFGKRLYLPSGDVLTVITDTAGSTRCKRCPSPSGGCRTARCRSARRRSWRSTARCGATGT